ncbi:MAG: protein-glutamate O-methyltransferase CheR [bacterium]|nr:protein-glutamate O-methyltransferase CheR [bacterium]
MNVPVKIASLVKERFGLDFGSNMTQYVEKRIKKRLAFVGLESISAYYQLLLGAGGREELVLLADELVVNETRFFRNSKHFDILTDLVLPDIKKRKKQKKNRSINIWSAGCSSGEEAYSLAMIALDSITVPYSWTVTITATDISRKALEKARIGIYSKIQIQRIPPHLQKRYLLPVDDNRFQVSTHLKKIVSFQQHNLVHDLYPPNMDIILCRNLTIYQQEDLTEKIVARFYASLSPGGYLFRGHSETVRYPGLKRLFQGETFFYQKDNPHIRA